MALGISPKGLEGGKMGFSSAGKGQKGGKEEAYDVVIVGGGLRASRRASTLAGAA